MGCAASGTSQRKGSLRLMSTKLTFGEDQLRNLNAYFRSMVEETRLKDESPNATSVEATVERLVQRLVIGTGNLDPSFSSMFLISLNEPRRIKRRKFEYLLRIDALSTPAVDSTARPSLRIEEEAAMPGFLRLKILNPTVGRWREYLDARGRLRRDLVKTKLANLLAATIKQDVVNRVDDRICSTPGQVVGAETLDKILKQPDYCKVFYGPGGADGVGIILAIAEGPLRETKNQRIVLIEDAGGILLRVGLEAFNTHEIEVRLLIGIGISSWSNLADYPRRVPLHHCDVLLHYTAAQSGMYAVAVGPYAGARCEDRATLWRIRVPAAEKIMNQHYADDSVPALTESVLVEVLHHLREARPLRLPIRHKDGQKEVTWCSQDRLRVVSCHILRTVHRWSLERVGPDPLTIWAPDTLAHHVLLSLDELVTALKCQNLRCYFHPRCNVMLQCARGGIVHHEDSYVADSRLLQSYLAILHRHSSSMRPGVPGPLDVMESELIVKWRNVMASIPRGTMDTDDGYSGRQLEYLSLILKEILRMKDASLQDAADNALQLKYLEVSHRTTEPIENLVYLLKLVLKQARDQIHAMSNRRMRTHDYRNILKKRKHCNTASHYEYSVGLLIDIVRQDRETAHMDLESYTIMAKMLLKWLYFGIDYDRKILEPILRPYLGNLFNGLHEYCWNAELWRSTYEGYTSEMRSLARFCKLVTTQKVSPSEGIIEFLSKGWYWAESMARTIERSENSLSLIFITAERTFRYNLVFADNKGLSAFSTWSKVRSIGNIARRKRITSRIIAPKSSSLVLNATAGNAEREGVAGHVELRDVSPLTYVASMCRCQARQRGPGDLISAMISLSKFRILQEAAAVLPQEEKVAMLDMVQRVARETSRRLRKSSCTGESAASSPRQTYTPRLESNFLDASPRPSPGARQRGIIAEHQRQLQLEMQEMNDTLTRNLRPRQRPAAWDSYSVSSWNSSIDSSVGTSTFGKYHIPIWDTIRGASSIRDKRATARSSANDNFKEMISREESPTWSTLDGRRGRGDLKVKDGDRLPSWGDLEATLNQRLYNYSHEGKPAEIVDEIGLDYSRAIVPRK